MTTPDSADAFTTLPPTLPPIRVKRLDAELPLPKRAHLGDAGADLHAAEDVTLQPGQRALVGTGIAIALPLGTVGLIHPRSGLAAKHGLTIVNAPGTVDAEYRGELKVCLLNTDASQPFEVTRGMRIAQLVVQRVELVEFEEVDELDATARGAAGYGSTGTH
ncbi:Deoxyuridine 5'-triphosphate nucleotidohydrolase [Corynebacterium glaucum]|uniref:Deoxyuridine 5'-triphosphate nucleotidohydrolase n=1 Tax=Corynebacterium glaucum TaxID=187491 RepID=A0A1Q2HX24_9CORY|nr:dUTP diphosphatase [Corynebacterium glaucum]AQQ15392.1 Deoxyuridine 5'-triphosphate nucleotidohydrolase [Corynebacterium glaucum]